MDAERVNDRFRLRTFMEDLVQAGECEVHDSPIELADIATVLEGNAKAVWFKKVGPEQAELVGNVMGARSRLAIALGTDRHGLTQAMSKRWTKPIPPHIVTSENAPVHEVVLTGEDADFTGLPVNLQHELDAAPYISAGIDFAVNPVTGLTNVGCRRIMLRGRHTAGVDLNAPSDLRAIYEEQYRQGKRLPVAFVIGAHPVDFLGALAITEPMDELSVIGGLRESSVPIVKCVTVDVYVPADAEYVLEGYLDEHGFSEEEGPYGEYIGYYGAMKRNPVFHLTAITKRRDALFQTVTIGGLHLAHTDTAQLVAVKTESAIWNSLKTSIREPLAVCCTPSGGGMYNVRVSLKQRYPGEPRNAIATIFGSNADVKHVFIVDDDIDVFSDEQIEWALATRFQADRDLIVASGFRAVPLDPSLDGKRTGGKAGFDLTKPFEKRNTMEFRIPTPPVIGERPRQTVEDALASGPCTFLELMESVGTRDGREVIREMDILYRKKLLTRTKDGRYSLRPAE